MLLHREQMDLIGSADRRAALKAEYGPGSILYLADVVKDRHGFTAIVVEVWSDLASFKARLNG